jgi:hypothetical protein
MRKFNTHILSIKLVASVIIIFFHIHFQACIPPEVDPEFAVSETTGFKPVYTTAENMAIAIQDPQGVQAPGKIYEYGQYLFVNEITKGIHVYDNSDPSDPIPVAFIKIPGNTEMAIRDSILYANHLGNIAAIRLKDVHTIEEVASLPLQGSSAGVLPPKGYYFECIDPAKGLVLNWVSTERNNMDCYALR